MSNQEEIIVVRSSSLVHDTRHGFVRNWGIASSNTGCQHLSMAFGVIPSGVQAKAHYHQFETAIYIISGKTRVFYGKGLEAFVDVDAGDFIYIPPLVVHSPINLETDPVEYVTARNAPDEIAHEV